MPSYRTQWEGDKAFVDALYAASGRLGGTVAQVVVGGAAVKIQEVMRRNLEAMIYSQPPSPSGYIRTRTLFRSTHASPPDADHSADEDRAHGGEDLVANAQHAAGLSDDGKIQSEIGSWISYADKVQEGVNQPEPRPFVDAAEDEANHIVEETMSAWAAKLQL